MKSFGQSSIINQNMQSSMPICRTHKWSLMNAADANYYYYWKQKYIDFDGFQITRVYDL